VDHCLKFEAEGGFIQLGLPFQILLQIGLIEQVIRLRRLDVVHHTVAQK